MALGDSSGRSKKDGVRRRCSISLARTVPSIPAISTRNGYTINVNPCSLLTERIYQSGETVFDEFVGNLEYHPRRAVIYFASQYPLQVVVLRS
jgi:hypothetical protein